MNEQAFIDAYNMFLQGGYRGSRDEFKELLAGNPDALNDSFEMFKQGGFNGTIEDYQTLIGITAVKKKDEPDMVSGLETGLLDSSEREQILQAEPPQVAIDATEVGQQKFISPIEAAEATARREEFEADRAVKMQQFQEQEQEKAEAAELERKKQSEILLQDPEFALAVSNLDAKLIAKEEEDVVPFMIDNFQKYGFTFEEAGLGDAMLVTTSDGKNTISIDLDPFTSKTEVLESQKLKDFISEHALSPKEKTAEESLNEKAMRAQQMRKFARVNPDGSRSTVLFTSFEEDGKYKVIPTLFPKDPNFYGSAANTWQELGFDDAKLLAEERGEVFEFDTQEEAEEFAQGSWKDRHSSHALGQVIYAEEGLDFAEENKIYQNYLKVRDKIDFIEGELAEFGAEYLKDLTEEERKKYSNLYVDGIMRDDIQQVLTDLKQQEQNLFDVVMDDDKIRLRESLDVELEKEYQKVAQVAAQTNAQAEFFLDNLQLQSLTTFGVKLEDLNSIKPQTEAEADLIDGLKVAYREAQATKTNAAQKYEQALTFYDAKHDQTITDEFTDNFTSVIQEFQKGLNNGNAGEVLLQLSTGLPFDFSTLDVNDPEDIKKAAQMIATFKGKNINYKDSRIMSRWNRAKGLKETMKVFADDPAELALTLAANSIGQMLPYGFEIITGSTVAGAGIGTAIAPGPGTVKGATRGFRVGFAATSLALEYTNAFFEAMQKKGLNPLDPEDNVAAINDPEIWEIAKERGMKRGIPIAVVDYLSAGLAGRVFKVSSMAGRGTRFTAFAAERSLIDPVTEGLGETLAQVNVGDEINVKDILAESIGGFGNNTSHMAVNLFVDSRKLSNIELADTFTDIPLLLEARGTNTQISKWSNNMERLGQIDQDVNQRIQKNLGLSKDADNLLQLGVGKNTPANKALKARVMQLLAAKEEYTATPNRKAVFGKKVADINFELAFITENKKQLPPGQRTLLEGLVESTPEVRQDVGRYTIDGKRVTRAQFIKYINEKNRPTLLGTMLTVDNDDETTKLLENKLDAVQIRETEEVDVREQTRDGQEVGTGVPQLETAQPQTAQTEDSSVGPIVAVAPFFNTTINTVEEANQLRQDKNYIQYKDNLTGIGNQLGLTVEVEEGIGGYKNEAGQEIIEISNRVVLPDATLQQAEEYAAMVAALAPETQESTIAAQYVQDNTQEQNGNEYVIQVSDTQAAMNALQQAGITDFSINESTNEVSFIDIFDFADPMLQDKIGIFAENLNNNNVNYEIKDYRPVQSNFIDKGTRKEIIGRIAKERAESRQGGQDLYNSLVQAIENDARFQGIDVSEYIDLDLNQLRQISEAASQEVQDLQQILEPGRPIESTQRLTLEIDETKGRRGINQREFFVEAANENLDNANKLNSFINKAFPGVVISTDQQTFDEIVTSPQVQKYSVGEDIVYGMTVNGDIYINPQVHNSQSQLFNTSIHEMGHVWIKFLKTTPKGQQIYNQGKELVKQTPLYQSQLKKFKNNEEKAVDETMAILIGDKGQQIADASLKSKFQQWLAGMWNYIKAQFKMSKDLTVDEIQDMNLDAFVGTALADIFSGREIKLSDQQLTQLKDGDVAFSTGQSMQSIINTGRENGISDASIREVLIGRGFNRTDINEAMTVRIDEDITMPSEFGNVEGGVEQGTQLFNEVRQGLTEFTTEETTMADVRQKAMDLMKENAIFQAQPEQTQLQLLSSFDRTLGTRANRNVQKEISSIRQSLKDRKKGETSLRDAQNRLKTFIRNNLPRSNTFTQAQINRLINRVTNTTEAKLLADGEFVIKMVQEQQAKMKKAMLNDILKVVKSKALTGFTKSGKRRAKGLSKEGQSYFNSAKKVLNAALKNDVEAMEELRNNIVTNEQVITDILQRQRAGETITTREQSLVFDALAFDNFADVMNMDLNQVQQLMNRLQQIRGESIATFKSRRAQRVAQYEAQANEVTEQIKETNPELFDEDGNVLEAQEFSAKRKQYLQKLKKLGVGKGLIELAKTMKYTSAGKFIRQSKDWFKHLGTLTNLLDRITEGKTVFRDKVYRRLNRMDNQYNTGLFETKTKLDELANSIEGVRKGYNEIKRLLNIGVVNMDVRNKRTGRIRKDVFSGDQLLRMYALSKNEIQRDVLLQQIGESGLAKVEEMLDPKAKEFADKVVDYLSNEYYESVNAVYSQMNDVNLGFIDNYFPTMKAPETVNKDDITVDLRNANFEGIFNAETAPALKERSDKALNIELDAVDFTSTLENHFQTMEKYKAYAEGTKMLNAFFNTPSVAMLIEQMGMRQPIKQAVNFAINPNAGMKSNLSNKFLDGMQVRFTGFALSFKAIQILKQATSFNNAYEEYSFFNKDSKVPNVVKSALDPIMFMVDGAQVMFDLAKDLVGAKGAIREAMEISPTFRKRVEQGLEGDIYGLESGSKTFKRVSKRTDKVGRAIRAFKSAAASPTIIGDILGVMGYMINYKRNIKNGMSKAEAVEAFNNYNATQQSRRGADKIPLQQSNNALQRGFTMFGSTLFLQMNKVMQTSTNIIRSVQAGKMPRKQDIRGFYLNAAIANVLFVGVSNIAKFVKGDDEDRMDALKKMAEAMAGMNLLYQIPYAGATIEEYDLVGRMIEGEDYKKKITYSDNVVNPIESVVRKIRKGLRNEEGTFKSQILPILELVIGAQVDPFIGLGNTFGQDSTEAEFEDNIYDVLGISPSYRPSKREVKRDRMNKTDMKKFFPDLYEDLYGPQGSMREIEDIKREIAKEKRQIREELKEEMYGD